MVKNLRKKNEARKKTRRAKQEAELAAKSVPIVMDTFDAALPTVSQILMPPPGQMHKISKQIIITVTISPVIYSNSDTEKNDGKFEASVLLFPLSE